MDDRAIQLLVEEEANRLGIVGAQVAILDRSGLREFAAGKRNLELDLPVTTETLFQIGSTTKVFNAALVLSLVDAGRLDLETPVADHLPEFRLADLTAERTITLRHLLSMSSGLDNGPYTDYGRGDDALARYVAALAAMPQVFRPGAAFGYSNAGSTVAGYLCSRIEGAAWEQLLDKRVLAPLGLKHSAQFAEDLLAHPVALGYRRREGGPPQRLPGWALPRSMAPAGASLCCSAGDLVRFARMFLDQGTAESGELVLSRASVEAMQSPQIALPTRLLAEHWCLGPFTHQWSGVRYFGHSGTNRGGSSLLVWCPQGAFAIATIVNVADQGYPFADRILDALLPALFGIDKPRKLGPESVSSETGDLEPFVGRFEAVSSVVTAQIKDGALVASLDNDLLRRRGVDATVTSELMPLGGARFLPRNPAFFGNRGADVAFFSEDPGGPPSHFLNGVFAFRRTR